ncbi:hypothetical protein CDAR_185381 [Caerostris darwini]|uniref:Small integral membrane protein 15 n=1 Tax=Caerostris darwini TaxID=1538125 RepID=A0AAV4ST24_9ARAC|nr:hypothetical protein CDAR_185381 [Caerostris darwini]
MVDLTGTGPAGPIEHGFSNWVFVLPAVIVLGLMGFFGYKLYQSLKERNMRREEKRKAKHQRKDAKKK